VTSVSTLGMSGQTPETDWESRSADMSWPQMSLPGTVTDATPNQVTPSADGKGWLELKTAAAAW
jgi:hypothetical protein